MAPWLSPEKDTVQIGRSSSASVETNRTRLTRILRLRLLLTFEASGSLVLGRTQKKVGFGLHFDHNNLPLHENGLRLSAFDEADNLLLSKVYYSIGGGFVVEEKDFNQRSCHETPVPYHFSTAEQLVKLCNATNFSISSLVMENEKAFHDIADVRNHFRRVWEVMKRSIERGLQTEGNLPGPLQIPRRAPALYRALKASGHTNHDPMNVLDWINMYAMAMSEENAAGGQVVTSPTNGACGIIPAVLSYYDHFIRTLDEDTLLRFFLTSGAVGCLFKLNASISGAEVGCQGEVGVACSMAAAGLVEILGEARNRPVSRLRLLWNITSG